MYASSGNSVAKSGYSETASRGHPSDLKKTRPCFVCNTLGHWNGDPECESNPKEATPIRKTTVQFNNVRVSGSKTANVQDPLVDNGGT